MGRPAHHGSRHPRRRTQSYRMVSSAGQRSCFSLTVSMLQFPYWDFYYFCNVYVCVCAGGVWTDIGHRACGGQRTMSWSWFSPSTFPWVPGLNSSHQTVLTESSHWSPLFLKACTLFVDIFHSGPQLRTSLEETWDLHSGTLLIPWRLLKKD